jgi:hypothetical protein
MYEIIGLYQGVVGNLNKTWLAKPGNLNLLDKFLVAYQDTLANMRNNAEMTQLKLQKFYDLDKSQANEIYQRLWHLDGLNQSLSFTDSALLGTEKLFSEDTGIAVPRSRDWILSRHD